MQLSLPIRALCAFALFGGTACGGVEAKLAAGDGLWQVAEYRVVLRDERTGAVRLDETVNNAGTVQFVTTYDDWGGQYAILDVPTPRPSYPSTAYYQADSPVTQLYPNTQYVLWDWHEGDLQFAWGNDWSGPEAIVLEPSGNGYAGTSVQSVPFGIAEMEIQEKTYVFEP